MAPPGLAHREGPDGTTDEGPGFGRRFGQGFGHGFGPVGAGPGFGPRGPRGGRARRGNVRAAVLALLAEQPQHGYQLLTELEHRSGGRWKPSPGSIYPVLSQLSDEGLVRPEEVDGRRVFHLTQAGTAAAAAAEADPKPWDSQGDSDRVDLRGALGGLAGATREAARTGDAAQVLAVREILEEARRAVYRILADGPATGTAAAD